MLDNLEIPPKLQEKRKIILDFEGLTGIQIKEKLRKPICFQSGIFGKSLWYEVYVYIGEFFLFLFNGDKECFSASYFPVNWLEEWNSLIPTGKN